ncbi:hypothetical protein ACROYT_G000390 [Oculina patagonica]
MNDIEEVLLALFIGLVVATFLLKTGRTLKAIEICKECLFFQNNEKALTIIIEIGDRVTEATCYGNLGAVFRSLSENVKAKEYHEKALAIRIEIGDREGEATGYGNLRSVFQSLGEYDKAKEHHKKALAIRLQIGDKVGEASSYGNLGTVFSYLGEYDIAKEHLEKALAIRITIGDKAGEATNYGNLGTVFFSLAEYDKAKGYLEKSLAIGMEIGDRAGEAVAYGNLGTVFHSLGDFRRAKENIEKALAIRIEIGDREGEARDYGNLGAVFQSLGEYDKAKEYHEKALVIKIEIGDSAGEAASYGNLGIVSQSVGEYVASEGYLEKALSISQDTGDAHQEFLWYCNLTLLKLSQEKIREAFHYLLLGIKKGEDLRGFLRDNDQFKIAFSDVHDFPYRKFSAFFCVYGSPNNALYVLELARARALADLMATQYSVERQISANPRSWIGIENIMKKENSCVCLYISYYREDVFLWILKTSGVIHFQRITEEILADLRLVKEKDDDEDDNQDPEPSLPLLYKMIIAPVADLLDEPEIILVPDRSLYQVPFAALTDESGKYLSETLRIRIVPSLTTVKLIQDSPADYYSQTGALIVHYEVKTHEKPLSFFMENSWLFHTFFRRF